MKKNKTKQNKKLNKTKQKTKQNKNKKQKTNELLNNWNQPEESASETSRSSFDIGAHVNLAREPSAENLTVIEEEPIKLPENWVMHETEKGLVILIY